MASAHRQGTTMSKLILITKWLWRAWPILMLVAIGLIHYSLCLTFDMHINIINKIVSASMQVIGGLIVLYSIDANIGMFKHHGLASIVWNWFSSFPLFKRTVTIPVKGGTIGFASAPTTLTVIRKCNTMEERLNELERQLEECHKLVHEKARLLNEQVEKVRIEMNTSLSSHGAELKKLSTLIENSVVGGFKSQAFGVLLVIYGAVLGALN